MKILLITPPLLQLNTPYPATAVLAGFLKKHGYSAVQADFGIELFVRLFSRAGLERVLKNLGSKRGLSVTKRSPTIAWFLKESTRILENIDPVVRFLQGRDPTLMYRWAGTDPQWIEGGVGLPCGPRMQRLLSDAENLSMSFGSLGIQDRVKHVASLFIDDLADVIREGIDSEFELSRYGEKLAASQPTFDPLWERLTVKESTLVDQMVDEITLEWLQGVKPDLLGLSVPFPGNVLGGFRVAKKAKEWRPSLRVVMGGGFVNTELRSLKDPRALEWVDHFTYDDGEIPLLRIVEEVCAKKSRESHAPRRLLRTRVKGEKGMEWISHPDERDAPFTDRGTPTYEGLPLEKYVSLFEMLNPMHRLWSDGRWNKLTLAHGCYWKKCRFCDVTLDYIGRYEAGVATELVDQVEAIIAETGQSGFHFVDEAAPPALLRAFSQEVIKRGIVMTWWGNLRFERAFTPELCSIMAQAGCIAATGGLEVASDRLLSLMNKGVSIEQVARVTRSMTDAGILVHAYLMYGFPSQTFAETVDALEVVRQLFEAGCIQSAFWHRFSATIHSPIGRSPEQFGIRLLPRPEVSFAENDLPFEDPTPVDHDKLGQALKLALYNYHLGAGWDLPVAEWFKQVGLKKIPKVSVPRDRIAQALAEKP